MKIKIPVNEFISWLKPCIFIFLMTIAFNGYANFLVYYGPDSLDECGHCYHRYHRILYHHYHHIVHHHKYRTCSVVRYPMVRHCVWIWDNAWTPCRYGRGFYSHEVIYYPDDIDPDQYYDPDLSTGDDNASVYPDMDIDE